MNPDVFSVTGTAISAKADSSPTKPSAMFISTFPFCKLEIFLPETHLEDVRAALQSVDAGHIGNYDSCLSYSPVTGCWRPLEGTSPYLGRTGEVNSERELKVEVTCRTERVRETVEAVKQVHPYEEPVINVIPLWGTGL